MTMVTVKTEARQGRIRYLKRCQNIRTEIIRLLWLSHLNIYTEHTHLFQVCNLLLQPKHALATIRIKDFSLTSHRVLLRANIYRLCSCMEQMISVDGDAKIVKGADVNAIIEQDTMVHVI